MSKPKLHLDEDASNFDIYNSLASKGHDITRTPNEWIKKKASDQEQLQKASGQGRSIFSGSLGFAVVVAPAVALLGGGSATAARTGGVSRQFPMNLFSFNAKDFLRIAKKSPKHKGIIVSPQKPVSIILKALDRFFNESSAEEMENQVRWLSDWEK